MATCLNWHAARDPTEGGPGSPYAHEAWRRAGFPLPPSRAVVDLRLLLGGLDLLGLDPALRRIVDGLWAIPEAYGPPDLALPLRLPPSAMGPAAGLDVALPGPVAAPPDDTVFVGVIDDGIAFAHERLRSRAPDGEHSTRVDMVWLQGADHVAGAVWGFGRELFAADIDQFLERRRIAPGRVDEASLYRDAGAAQLGRKVEAGPPTLAFAASHGTAVADLAAGFRPDDPSGARVRMLAINLPSSVSEDTSGAFIDGYVALGVDRILRHVLLAEHAAGRRFPVTIVMSLATTAGPKDGGGLLDRVMATTARLRRALGADIRFVLPAGNARLARLTARVEATPGGTRDILWRIQPDDATPCFVEIWGPPLPAADAARLEVGLAPPGRDEPAMLAPPPGAERRFALLRDGRELARAHYELARDPEGGASARQRVVLVVPPTIAYAGAAAPGDWTIRLRARGSEPVRADLFIQRDDTLPGFRRRGRQSRFVDPDYAAWGPDGRVIARDPARPAAIRRAGTLNALACGSDPSIETVGGLVARRADGAPEREAPYSGLGFAEDGLPAGPRFHEVCERGPSLPGVLAAATLSGPRVSIGGTSLAAPRRARRLIG